MMAQFKCPRCKPENRNTITIAGMLKGSTIVIPCQGVELENRVQRTKLYCIRCRNQVASIEIKVL